MSHSRKRVNSSNKKNTAKEEHEQEEVPASQDPMAIITDPIEEPDQQQQQATEEEATPPKKPRISVTYENKETFQPLSSSFVTEVKESPHVETPTAQTSTSTATSSTASTAVVEYVPPPKPVIELYKGVNIEYKNNKEGYAKVIKHEILKAIIKRGGVATPGEKIMLKQIEDVIADPVKNKFYYYKFFPPCYLNFVDEKYEKDGQTIPKWVVKCDVMQPSYEGLKIDGPIQRATFCELAPLGNYHPEGFKWRAKDLSSAQNKAAFTLAPVSEHPEFVEDANDYIQWLEKVYELGMKRIEWDPKALTYQLLQGEGLKPDSTDPVEREAYHRAFLFHARKVWKNGKDDKYPYSYGAKKQAFKKCSIAEARKIEKEGYEIPGDLKIIRTLFEDKLPKPIKIKGKDGKEEEVQQYLVHQDVHIFDVDGKYIKMKDGKEIKAFTKDEKGRLRFIEPDQRERDIQLNEWVTPRLILEFSFKPPGGKDDPSPWTIGMARRPVGIQKRYPPDVHEKQEKEFNESKADESKLPQGCPMLSDDDIQVMLKKEQERLGAELDTAMLAYDIPQAGAAPAASSTDTQSQIHSTQQQQASASPANDDNVHSTTAPI